MAAWDELKVVLARLCDEQPRVLMGWPNPRTDHVPPFSIKLASWATATAADLHRQFGDDVELTVGALPYPPGRPPRFRPAAGLPPDLLDPQQVTGELDGPAVVRSGHNLWHGSDSRARSYTVTRSSAASPVPRPWAPPSTG